MDGMASNQFKVDVLRQAMYQDESFAEYTKNDGMISLMHCQEQSLVEFIAIIRLVTKKIIKIISKI